VFVVCLFVCVDVWVIVNRHDSTSFYSFVVVANLLDPRMY
jgi:hypothetical protein